MLDRFTHEVKSPIAIIYWNRKSFCQIIVFTEKNCGLVCQFCILKTLINVSLTGNIRTATKQIH